MFEVRMKVFQFTLLASVRFFRRAHSKTWVPWLGKKNVVVRSEGKL